MAFKIRVHSRKGTGHRLPPNETSQAWPVLDYTYQSILIPLSFDQPAKLQRSFGIGTFRVVIDEPVGVVQSFLLLTGLIAEDSTHEAVVGGIRVDGQDGVEVMQSARRVAISAGDAQEIVQHADDDGLLAGRL